MRDWSSSSFTASRRLLAGLALAGAIVSDTVQPTALGAQRSRTRATITGVVVDTTLAPVQGAILSIVGTKLTALSDHAGRFVIQDIAPELQVVSLKRVGFTPRFFHLQLQPGQRLDFEIEITPLPHQLPVVHVEEKAVKQAVFKPDRLAYTTKFDDFYIRRSRGSGKYYTRDDLDRSGATDLIDLFRSVAGARVALMGYDRLVRFDGCPNPTLYVDGVKAGIGLYALPELRLLEVEAVEIYAHGASLPPEAVGGCAAVFIWMRTR
jgi:Carboxypeptidase regulatory-like domain